MAAHVSRSPYNGSSGGPPTDRHTSWVAGDEKRLSNGPPSKGYMHLKDLINDGLPEFSRDEPLHIQLDRAEKYISSVSRSVEFRRPDIAYKDFLRGFEIVVNNIPQHRDFAQFTQTNKGWDQRYRELCKKVGNMEPMMEQIRHMIEEDNLKSGVMPKAGADGHHTTHNRSSSSSNSAPPAVTNGFANGVHAPSPPRRESPEPANYEIPSSLVAGSPKTKPAVRPKPANLQGGAVQTGDNQDALSQRFARLRTPSSDQNQGHRDVKIPIPEDFLNKGHSAQSTKSEINGSPAAKPLGPRDMLGTQDVPIVPPKVPLSLMSSLPQAPAPTYSPAKSVPPHSLSQPPRSSFDQTRTDGPKKQYYYNQPISRPQSPYKSSSSKPAIAPKGNSHEIPLHKTITADVLMTYMKKYNVLLIDVRSRIDFDEGHIFSSSIICIEPISLRAGLSSQDLEDRLVVSPEPEKTMFERRDEFDLVVYYDQDTSSTDYLTGPPNANRPPGLRALYDTLFEFNVYKPLKDGRPPALLIGGLEAWIDLVGPQSLAKSKTADIKVPTKIRPGARGPGKFQRGQRLTSANSVIEVRRRRLQQQRRIDPAEAQALVQTARTEEIDNSHYAQEDSDSEQLEADEEPPSPFIPDYESFLRRFPDINVVPQSMVRPSYPPPSPVVDSIERPDHPSVPSRPAPAVPRPSYSGLADKNLTQAPLARQVSATRPPLYSGSASYRNMKLPYCGLTNLGNTCYLNATLQCLSATWPLSRFFLSGSYRKFIQPDNPLGSENVLPPLFGSLLSNMWSPDRRCYAPQGFAKFVMRKMGWSINDQQDPSEFLIMFLDILHEDFNLHHQRHNLAELTPDQERHRNAMPIPRASEIEWQRYEHKHRSFISSLFTSQQVSRVVCNDCGYRSFLYETFTTIDLAIPKKPTTNVRDCFQEYCKEEPIVKKCDQCGSSNARRAYLFTRWPQFLVITFKRFEFERGSRKLDTPIAFPFMSMNLDEFTFPYRRQEVAKSGDEFQQLDMATMPPFTYDLYGIVRHRGATVNSGHYTCLVQDHGRGCWRNFDDSVTRDFDPAKPPSDLSRDLNREVYILFYQRGSVR